MKKRKKELGHVIPAAISAEMALPRITKSARIAELELDSATVLQKPRTVMPGTVDKSSSFGLRGCGRQRKFRSKASPNIEKSALKIH
jgi:hypothetical protein